MTAPQTIAINTIDEDRKYWRMVIEAIGEDPLRVQPGNLTWLIDKYARALREGATFEPIVLVEAGEKRFLYDGHHRLSAHKKCGRTEIAALVYRERDFLDLLPHLSRMTWLRMLVP